MIFVQRRVDDAETAFGLSSIGIANTGAGRLASAGRFPARQHLQPKGPTLKRLVDSPSFRRARSSLERGEDA